MEETYQTQRNVIEISVNHRKSASSAVDPRIKRDAALNLFHVMRHTVSPILQQHCPALLIWEEKRTQEMKTNHTGIKVRDGDMADPFAVRSGKGTRENAKSVAQGKVVLAKKHRRRTQMQKRPKPGKCPSRCILNVKLDLHGSYSELKATGQEELHVDLEEEDYIAHSELIFQTRQQIYNTSNIEDDHTDIRMDKINNERGGTKETGKPNIELPNSKEEYKTLMFGLVQPSSHIGSIQASMATKHEGPNIPEAAEDFGKKQSRLPFPVVVCDDNQNQMPDVNQKEVDIMAFSEYFALSPILGQQYSKPKFNFPGCSHPPSSSGEESPVCSPVLSYHNMSMCDHVETYLFQCENSTNDVNGRFEQRGKADIYLDLKSAVQIMSLADMTAKTPKKMKHGRVDTTSAEIDLPADHGGTNGFTSVAQSDSDMSTQMINETFAGSHLAASVGLIRDSTVHYNQRDGREDAALTICNTKALAHFFGQRRNRIIYEVDEWSSENSHRFLEDFYEACDVGVAYEEQGGPDVYHRELCGAIHACDKGLDHTEFAASSAMISNVGNLKPICTNQSKFVEKASGSTQDKTLVQPHLHGLASLSIMDLMVKVKVVITTALGKVHQQRARAQEENNYGIGRQIHERPGMRKRVMNVPAVGNQFIPTNLLGWGRNILKNVTLALAGCQTWMNDVKKHSRTEEFARYCDNWETQVGSQQPQDKKLEKHEMKIRQSERQDDENLQVRKKPAFSLDLIFINGQSWATVVTSTLSWAQSVLPSYHALQFQLLDIRVPSDGQKSTDLECDTDLMMRTPTRSAAMGCIEEREGFRCRSGMKNWNKHICSEMPTADIFSLGLVMYHVLSSSGTKAKVEETALSLYHTSRYCDRAEIKNFTNEVSDGVEQEGKTNDCFYVEPTMTPKEMGHSSADPAFVGTDLPADLGVTNVFISEAQSDSDMSTQPINETFAGSRLTTSLRLIRVTIVSYKQNDEDDTASTNCNITERGDSTQYAWIPECRSAIRHTVDREIFRMSEIRQPIVRSTLLKVFDSTLEDDEVVLQNMCMDERILIPFHPVSHHNCFGQDIFRPSISSASNCQCFDELFCSNCFADWFFIFSGMFGGEEVEQKIQKLEVQPVMDKQHGTKDNDKIRIKDAWNHNKMKNCINCLQDNNCELILKVIRVIRSTIAYNGVALSEISSLSVASDGSDMEKSPGQHRPQSFEIAMLHLWHRQLTEQELQSVKCHGRKMEEVATRHGSGIRYETVTWMWPVGRLVKQRSSRQSKVRIQFATSENRYLFSKKGERADSFSHFLAGKYWKITMIWRSSFECGQSLCSEKMRFCFEVLTISDPDSKGFVLKANQEEPDGVKLFQPRKRSGRNYDMQDKRCRLRAFQRREDLRFSAEDFADAGFYLKSHNIIECFCCHAQHYIEDIIARNPSDHQWHRSSCVYARNMRGLHQQDVVADTPGRVSDDIGDPPGQQSVYVPPGDSRKETYRLSTFEQFPVTCPISRKSLAKSGFFFTGFFDRVKCFACGRTVERWEVTDNPAELRWHKPECSFPRGDPCGNMPINDLFNRLHTNPVTRQQQARQQLEQVLTQTDPNTGAVIRTVRYPADLPERIRRTGGTFDIGPGNSVIIQSGPGSRPNPAIHVGNVAAPPPPRRWRMANVVSADHRRCLNNLYLNRELDRLASFARWPASRPNVAPAALARSGFFYLGDMDRTQCFSCGGVLRNWTLEDDAHEEHRTHFPNCHMVRDAENRNVPVPEQLELPEDRMVLYPCRYPANPHMRVEAARLDTFDHRWPAGRIGATPAIIAQAGFFFLGERDRVKCWYCNGGLQNWEYDDMPWNEHAKWFPNCQFLLQNKGQGFVHQHLAMSPHLARPIIARQEGSPIDPAGGEVARAPDIPPGGPSVRQPSPPPTIIDPQEEMRKKKERIKNVMKTSGICKNVIAMGFSEDVVQCLLEERIDAGNEANSEDIYESASALLDDVMKKEEEMQREAEEEARNQASMMSSVLSAHSANLSGFSGSLLGPPTGSAKYNFSFCDEDEPMDEDLYNSITRPPSAISVASSVTVAKQQHQKEKPSESMQEQLQKIEEERMCKICFSNTADMVFIPCSHMCCCMECTQAIRQCPVCRTKIEKAIKTYVK